MFETKLKRYEARFGLLVLCGFAIAQPISAGTDDDPAVLPLVDPNGSTTTFAAPADHDKSAEASDTDMMRLLRATKEYEASFESSGSSHTWRTYSFQENGEKVCFVSAQPQKSKGKYGLRDEAHFNVTHRPYLGKENVASFIAGYRFNTEYDIETNIDQEWTTTFFAEGSEAWANDSADILLVEEMLQGKELKISGVSSKGVSIEDTFSLKGFKKAYEVMSRMCDVEPIQVQKEISAGVNFGQNPKKSLLSQVSEKEVEQGSTKRLTAYVGASLVSSGSAAYTVDQSLSRFDSKAFLYDPNLYLSDPNLSAFDPNAPIFDPNSIPFDPEAPVQASNLAALDPNSAEALIEALFFDPEAPPFDPGAVPQNPATNRSGSAQFLFKPEDIFDPEVVFNPQDILDGDEDTSNLLEDKSQVKTGPAKGFAISGGLAYAFNDRTTLRAEGSVNYKKSTVSEIKSLTYDRLLKAPTGEITELSGFARGIVDYKVSKRFSPYLGLGVGVTRVNFKNIGYSSSFTDFRLPLLENTHQGLAFEIMGGAKLDVTDKVGLVAEFSRSTARNVKTIDSIYGIEHVENVSVNAIRLGAVFKF